MTKLLSMLFFCLFLVACNSNKGKPDDDCKQIAQEDGTTDSSCTIIDDSTDPVIGTTTSGTTGSTTGSTTGGTTTGSTTGSTTGGTTTGSTTGSTTGGTTTGSTTGSTTGGTTTGSTTGSTTGGTTTGSTTGSTTGGTTTDVPAAALTWDTDIYFVNFSQTQEAKVLKAVALMKKVIASKQFKDRIINHTYNGKKTFVDNGGFTNTQIYTKILDGAEKVGITTKNNTMNVELELYYAATSTVGYTYPNSTRIWMNTKYFNNYTSLQVAGNLMHEWMHKLGFGHASSWSTSRDYSVPYAIGYLMSELTAQYNK